MSAALDLLKAFATDRQIPDLVPDAEGRAGLKVDGRVQVDLKADGDRLYVYGSLGVAPRANEEAVLTVLLAANRAGSIGEGPVMSIDPTIGDIVLSQEIDARTASSATLLRAIGGVAEQLEAWTIRLNEIDTQLRVDEPGATTAERLAQFINRA